MRKRHLLLFALVLGMLPMIACGGGAPISSPMQTPTPQVPAGSPSTGPTVLNLTAGDSTTTTPDCGAAWQATLQQLSAPSSTTSVHILSWNNYDKGVQLERGIDNCVVLQPSIAGDTLSWIATGNTALIHHYELFSSPDGANLTHLASALSGATSLDLSSTSLVPGQQYYLVLSAIGKPSVLNKVSSPITYVAAARVAPGLALSVTPLSGIAPVPVTAIATPTLATNDSITSSTIDFGDGATINATSGSHTYSAPGTYSVRASVTDRHGVTASASATVVVAANQPPVARLALSTTSGTTPVAVTANTAGSADPDGAIQSTSIDFGDSAIVSAASATHTYTSAGTFTVRATVTDNLGASASATSSVVVSAPVVPPTLPPTAGIPAQFAKLRSDSFDYTCGGATPCTTWPSPPMPNWGGTYTDPTWGTTTQRVNLHQCIVDATHTSACSTRNIMPDYSKQQAWNVDGAKMLLLDDMAWYHVYDASTLKDLGRISDAKGLCCDHDVRWSNSEANIIYYVTGLSLMSYNVSTHALNTVHTFSCSDGTHTGTKFGNGDEGNPSNDDRYWAGVCSYYDGAYFATISAITYDRVTDTVLANIPAAQLCGGACIGFSKSDLINWVGMSPSGKYTIVQWNKSSNIEANYIRPMGTEIFDQQLTYQGKLCAANPHSDVGYDVNGNEVIVIAGCDLTYQPRMMTVTQLDTRIQTKILWPSTWANDALYHISMRATNGSARGWALISTAVSANTQGRGWGASEMVAVQIDTTKNGNQTWRRVGRAFSIRDTQYYAEPHAVPNRDFTKVLWGSDWLTDGGQISACVININ